MTLNSTNKFFSGSTNSTKFFNGSTNFMNGSLTINTNFTNESLKSLKPSTNFVNESITTNSTVYNSDDLTEDISLYQYASLNDNFESESLPSNSLFLYTNSSGNTDSATGSAIADRLGTTLNSSNGSLNAAAATGNCDYTNQRGWGLLSEESREILEEMGQQVELLQSDIDRNSTNNFTEQLKEKSLSAALYRKQQQASIYMATIKSKLINNQLDLDNITTLAIQSKNKNPSEPIFPGEIYIINNNNNSLLQGVLCDGYTKRYSFSEAPDSLQSPIIFLGTESDSQDERERLYLSENELSELQ